MKLLYVENDATFAALVCAEFLAEHEVQVVASVAAGREAFAAQAFDVVLVDYDLDDGKGDALVSSLRRGGFRGRIIAVSSREAGNEALMRAGADTTCNKLRFSTIAEHLGSPRPVIPVFRTCQHLEGAGASCDDRAAVFAASGQLLLVIADGAGGSAGGARAAQQVVGALGASLGRSSELAAHDWVRALTALDDALCRDRLAGETTAVVAAIAASGQLRGASVGDSCAWLFSGDGEALELSAEQQRKPLLGSGDAQPTPLAGTLAGETLLLASDGLLRYVPTATLSRAVSEQRDLNLLALTLAARARAATGSLQDDLSFVLCRRAGDSPPLARP